MNILSIVIPTLNEEYFLPNLLDDLIQQTDKNFEIIIVDAKSDDQTKAIVTKYQENIRIKFCEIDKRNVSYQRNIGATKATGDYIFFLDADSQLPRGYIKYLKKH